MADINPVTRAIEDFGEERFEEGRASRQAEVDALTAARAELSRELDAQVRTFADHMATHALTPEPQPQPPAVKTLFGACPQGGASIASVITKFGTGAAIRLFDGGKGFSYIPTRPAGVSKMHVSWKPSLSSTQTDATIVAAMANLRDGDLVEVWHEADVKHRNGSGDLTALLVKKNWFYDKVVALRNGGKIPNVMVVNTWGGWAVDETSTVNPASPSLHAKADLLGVDMDGIPAKPDFYPFFTRMMGKKFQAAYKAGGYIGWTVPEFCMPSTSTDPGNTKRVAWMKSEAVKVAAGIPSAGIPAPVMIAWFDAAGIVGEAEKLTTTNEIAAWSSLVASTR